MLDRTSYLFTNSSFRNMSDSQPDIEIRESSIKKTMCMGFITVIYSILSTKLLLLQTIEESII